jgi:hypothetical protein
MLTRHFYELEDVCFCLRGALRAGDVSRAVFWAHELLLSLEDDELHKSMVASWLMFLGAEYIHWFDAWFQVGPGTDIGGCKRLVLVAEFANMRQGLGRCIGPCSTFIIAGRGLAELEDIDKVTAGIGENDAFAVYRYLALAPADIIEAVAAYVDTAALFDSLKSALGHRGAPKVLLAVAACQLLCLPSYPEPLITSMGPFVAKLLEAWEGSLGRKAGRRFPVAVDMLPRRYKQICQKDAAWADFETLIEKGTLFWRELGVLYQDKAARRALVSEYLPDGLPSTWAKAELALSHPIELSDDKIGLIKTDMRMALIWNFRPALRKEWSKRIDALLKGCAAPDR